MAKSAGQINICGTIILSVNLLFKILRYMTAKYIYLYICQAQNSACLNQRN